MSDKPRVEIDARRLLCPMPVIKVQDAMEKLAIGDRVKIICRDPGVRSDIPLWCKIHGHHVIALHEDKTEKEITLELEVGEKT